MKIKYRSGYAAGGFIDNGASVDPMSGNEVPTGSLQKEVRDDVPAQLSEGEFVLPADVVRFIGLDKLMKMRAKAKEGLSAMEEEGQMGGQSAPQHMSEDYDADETAEIDAMIDGLDGEDFDGEMQHFAEGGSVRRRREMPTYEQFTGRKYSRPELIEHRVYVNDAGNKINIKFIKGQPLQPIPEGYYPYVEGKEEEGNTGGDNTEGSSEGTPGSSETHLHKDDPKNPWQGRYASNDSDAIKQHHHMGSNKVTRVRRKALEDMLENTGTSPMDLKHMRESLTPDAIRILETRGANKDSMEWFLLKDKSPKEMMFWAQKTADTIRRTKDLPDPHYSGKPTGETPEIFTKIKEVLSGDIDVEDAIKRVVTMWGGASVGIPPMVTSALYEKYGKSATDTALEDKGVTQGGQEDPVSGTLGVTGEDTAAEAGGYTTRGNYTSLTDAKRAQEDLTEQLRSAIARGDAGVADLRKQKEAADAAVKEWEGKVTAEQERSGKLQAESDELFSTEKDKWSKLVAEEQEKVKKAKQDQVDADKLFSTEKDKWSKLVAEEQEKAAKLQTDWDTDVAGWADETTAWEKKVADEQGKTTALQDAWDISAEKNKDAYSSSMSAEQEKWSKLVAEEQEKAAKLQTDWDTDVAGWADETTEWEKKVAAEQEKAAKLQTNWDTSAEEKAKEYSKSLEAEATKLADQKTAAEKEYKLIAEALKGSEGKRDAISLALQAAKDKAGEDISALSKELFTVGETLAAEQEKSAKLQTDWDTDVAGWADKTIEWEKKIANEQEKAAGIQTNWDTSAEEKAKEYSKSLEAEKDKSDQLQIDWDTDVKGWGETTSDLGIANVALAAAEKALEEKNAELTRKEGELDTANATIAELKDTIANPPTTEVSGGDDSGATIGGTTGGAVYDQAYWKSQLESGVSQADMAAEQAALVKADIDAGGTGVNASYSGNVVPTSGGGSSSSSGSSSKNNSSNNSSSSSNSSSKNSSSKNSSSNNSSSNSSSSNSSSTSNMSDSNVSMDTDFGFWAKGGLITKADKPKVKKMRKDNASGLAAKKKAKEKAKAKKGALAAKRN